MIELSLADASWAPVPGRGILDSDPVPESKNESVVDDREPSWDRKELSSQKGSDGVDFAEEKDEEPWTCWSDPGFSPVLFGLFIPGNSFDILVLSSFPGSVNDDDGESPYSFEACWSLPESEPMRSPCGDSTEGGIVPASLCVPGVVCVLPAPRYPFFCAEGCIWGAAAMLSSESFSSEKNEAFGGFIEPSAFAGAIPPDGLKSAVPPTLMRLFLSGVIDSAEVPIAVAAAAPEEDEDEDEDGIDGANERRFAGDAMEPTCILRFARGCVREDASITMGMLFLRLAAAVEAAAPAKEEEEEEEDGLPFASWTSLSNSV